MERPVAVRRWHQRKKEVQAQAHQPQAHQSQSSSSIVVEEDRGSECGRRDREKTPVLIVDTSSDEEGLDQVQKVVKEEVEEGEEVEGDDALTEEKEEEKEEEEKEEEENEEEQDEEEECSGSNKRAKRSSPEGDDILDPDENWEAPAAGAITPYVEPGTDWQLVSRKNVGSGSSLTVMQPLQVVPASDREALQVRPLREADADVCVAELSDSDEEFDEIFPDHGATANFGSDNDDRKNVINALSVFERLRIRYVRDKVARDCALKAGKNMNDKRMWVNRTRRFGPVPGVEVGDIFYFRMALCVVGLHYQTQAGIASSLPTQNQFGELVACSLVLSGGYEDDVDSGETLTYTGQGQNDHQKLVKGNLGLANSCKYDVPVRVIRGVKDKKSPSGTIYSYDGLYRVVHYWTETGLSGFRVYKYSLEREPGQPELGSRLVKFSGKLQAKQEKRKAVVCEDISGGRELVSICAVNDVDAAPTPPPRFNYITKVIFPPGFLQPSYPSGCRCQGHCGDLDNCLCIRKNGGKMPYTDGALCEFQTIVYECGPMCRCPPSCPLRLSQRGQTRKLEVFKTEDRGWGVRCWEAIPFGSFICEYVGELISNEEAERRVGQDEYIFDIDCIKGSRCRGVDISGFFEEKEGGELCEVLEDSEMSIDAGSSGNVSRFINHSCDPNMFVQCVFYDHNDLTYPHVMMFAMKNIGPFEELCYDYGYVVDSVKGKDGQVKKKRCYCGSRKCRKRLY